MTLSLLFKTNNSLSAVMGNLKPPKTPSRMYSRDRSNHSMSVIYSTTSSTNKNNENASSTVREHLSRRTSSSNNNNHNNSHISMLDSDAQSLPQGTFAIKAGPATIMSQWVVTLDDGDDCDEDEDDGEDHDEAVDGVYNTSIYNQATNNIENNTNTSIIKSIINGLNTNSEEIDAKSGVTTTKSPVNIIQHSNFVNNSNNIAMVTSTPLASNPNEDNSTKSNNPLIHNNTNNHSPVIGNNVCKSQYMLHHSLSDDLFNYEMANGGRLNNGNILIYFNRFNYCFTYFTLNFLCFLCIKK
jgi:hypothetical protein